MQKRHFALTTKEPSECQKKRAQCNTELFTYSTNVRLDYLTTEKTFPFDWHYLPLKIDAEPKIRRMAGRGMSLIKGGQQVVLGEEAQVVATNA